MKRPADPVRDSKVFQEALQHILIEDADAYNSLVGYMLHGQAVSKLAERQRVTVSSVYGRIKKGKLMLRQYLGLRDVDVDRCVALDPNSQLDRLASAEVGALNEKFPLIQPPRLK